MNTEEFCGVIAELKERPIPGKHLYVWNGDENIIFQIVGKGIAQILDLAKDVQVNNSCESGEIDFSRQIERSLEEKLFRLYSEVTIMERQQILLVYSPSILARYNMGLTVFYNYYLGDRTMVILVIPKPQFLTNLGLPDYVIYAPEETFNYLVNLVQSENVVE